MMNYRMTAERAVRYAIADLDLRPEDVRCDSVLQRDGLYEITLRTLFQKYELYADAATGELLGISTEPVMDTECLYAAAKIA